MKLECFAFLTLLPPFLNVFKNCPSLDSTHPHVLHRMHRNVLSLCDLFMGVFPRPMQVHHSQGPYLGATCPILRSFGLGVMENEEMTDTKYVKLESGGSCTWKHTRSRRKSQLFLIDNRNEKGVHWSWWGVAVGSSLWLQSSNELTVVVPSVFTGFS